MSVSDGKPPSVEVVPSESGVPRIDMVFESDEKAYQFYCLYAREMGFGVRKHLVKRRSSGVVYSRVFCCYKEGFCRTVKEGKKPRPDARTGCGAHITVRIMDDGKFRVTEFEPNHNHDLVMKAPGSVAELVNVSDRKINQNFVGRQAIGRPALRSCMPSKSMNVPKLGSAGAPMRCMQQKDHRRQSSNPSLEPGDTCLPICNADNENWMPRLEMEFENDEEAYQFYIDYATQIGFSVRKHLVKKRASGVIYSRRYCCHKEGYSRKKNEQQQGRSLKPYDRTGCLASMTIKITKNGKYRVMEFQPKHNHPLVIPTKAHLFKWQWRRGLIQTQDDFMDSTDDQGLTTEPSKEQVNGEVESCQNTDFLSLGYKNYIPSRRMNSMLKGDLGAVLQYFQERQAEDPSFYYALQMDLNDQVTNIFWADAKSHVDFEYFGDVLCFDTSYRTSDYGRPLAQFLGVNHHKQAIIFGAALIYDETEESFKWLFETFKNVMFGKQPKVILTDQSEPISNALSAVWPGTVHRLCVWHMYNSAVKHLNFVFEGSTTFSKDFNHCVYDIEEEDEFLSEWKTMLEKYDLNSNAWLCKLYEDREKWALAFGREIFCADMKNTLVNESMNTVLKSYLNFESLLNFFQHYENMVNERRHAELRADCDVHQSILNLPTSRMLRQAANVYTPAVFKIFQREFELSMDCMVYNCGQVETSFEYKVIVEDCPKEFIVRFESSNGTVTCSCKKFEFVGIQCRHVLKTLDINNIKELPPQYILKRWTKDAKRWNIGGISEVALDDDGKISQVKRYKSLCFLVNKIAVKAAETVDSHMFIESLSDQLVDQVNKILNTQPEKP